eukprot:scaffold258672_cov24-Tisochrysis_lutea.AAC.3
MMTRTSTSRDRGTASRCRSGCTRCRAQRERAWSRTHTDPQGRRAHAARPRPPRMSAAAAPRPAHGTADEDCKSHKTPQPSACVGKSREACRAQRQSFSSYARGGPGDPAGANSARRSRWAGRCATYPASSGSICRGCSTPPRLARSTIHSASSSTTAPELSTSSSSVPPCSFHAASISLACPAWPSRWMVLATLKLACSGGLGICGGPSSVSSPPSLVAFLHDTFARALSVSLRSPSGLTRGTGSDFICSSTPSAEHGSVSSYGADSASAAPAAKYPRQQPDDAREECAHRWRCRVQPRLWARVHTLGQEEADALLVGRVAEHLFKNALDMGLIRQQRAARQRHHELRHHFGGEGKRKEMS